MGQPSGKVTVREATIDLLRRLDMTTVFGNPGSTELPFLSNWPNDFRYVLGLQEASVVAMADGYARATGRAAFCNLHSAAGVGHALGSVFTAYRNQAPIVISAGQQARSLLPLQPFLGATEAANFPKPYVKWSCEPARAEDVPAALAQAYYIAMQRPRGPTFVSIPMDDWERETLPTMPRTVSQETAPDPALVEKLVAALQKAQRPVIVIGPEVDDESAADQAVTLAETLGAPVWVSPFSSRASFPELHRNFAGFLQAAPQAISNTLSEYDVIVVLGAPVFTFHVVGDCPLFRSDVSLFQITSDGGAAATSLVGTGIVGSVRLSLAALLQRLPSGKHNTTLSPPPRDTPQVRDPIPAAYLLHAIARSMPADTIVVEEAPSHRPLMHRYLPIAKPGNFFTMASGGLGYGLPAAVGVALARPGQRIVCLIGDGSLMYSIQALWTAAQLKLPVSVIVINNSGYGAMRSFMQTLNVQSPPGIDLPGIDPARIAEGFGCSATRITEAAGLAKALAEALSHNGPTLLDVVVDPDVPKLY